MREYSFFSAILGLSLEWRIANMAVDKQTGIIEIHLQNLGAEISFCSTCGIGPVSVSTRNARWMHENYLNFNFAISSTIPVLSCEHCGMVSQQVPWEKPGNSFREIVSD